VLFRGALPSYRRRLEHLDQYTTLFVDSLTAITRLSFRWAEQQPEAFSDRSGKKDTRSAYGLLGREMVLWLNQLQHARDKNVIFVGVLERNIDEFHVATWQLQSEGSKTSRELPGIVDEILTMQFLDFGDGKPPMRGFVCTSPNSWGYPGKDRSGRLEQVEPPDLGKLLTKLTTKHQAGD
jgi:AAA domain